MTNKLLYALIPFVLGACRDNYDQKQETDKILNRQGQERVLVISLSPNYITHRHELRFFDTDGDGKTVEQFVDVYSPGGVRMPTSNGIDLLRSGASPVFDRDNTPNYRRTMTDEEAHRLDAQYQSLVDLIKSNPFK